MVRWIGKGGKGKREEARGRGKGIEDDMGKGTR